MLIGLGFAMIAVFMYLILSKRLTPVVALILVPVTFGIAAVQFGAARLPEDEGVADTVMAAIKSFAPTAALLFFAIIFFGLMIDVGLFDPLIRLILRVVGNSPVRLVMGTAVLAGLVSLDGDGSTTFIITVSALMPIYRRLGMSPVVLTVVAVLANGVLNIVPWGGPTVRAATVLNVSPNDLFLPMVPGMIAAIGTVFVLAYFLGRSEKKRLEASGDTLELVAASVGATAGTRGDGPVALLTRPGGGSADLDLDSLTGGPVGGGTDDGRDTHGSDGSDDLVGGLDPDRPTLRPKLIWVNLGLTVSLLVLLGLDEFPLALLFMIAAAIALVVNFPKQDDQAERIKAHAGSIVGVVSMVFAAAVLVGVLEGTGMVTAMADAIVDVVPSGLGPWFAVITGLLSMPFTFFMSNDAFYFGVLPILSEAAGQYGITPVEMAQASIIGQPVHMTSPLVPAMLLLISLARVGMAEFHKKVLWRAALCSVVMLVVAILLGVIPLG
ncbi:CitMHS family transporter [Nakamurella deserti]|uniref:CitMHS family transporter n=1 Tax=Nakamurella deserti TaxID=2164074 RepID=UPI000DBE5A43|nr:SLC13 family permease [Nakamurella deserti]